MDITLYSSSDDSGLQTQAVDYIEDSVAYLTALALGHALPTAYHDKHALSPALRDQLIKQVEAQQAGSAMVVSPALD
jgi:hypothetical protein